MTLKARPTVYAGVRMRSRLEASFAESLDNAGLQWQYEGDAYASSEGQYLPDFITPSSGAGSRVFHEIKPPNADFDAALERMHIILDSEPEAVLRVWTRQTYEGPFQAVLTCLPSEGCGESICPRIGKPKTGPASRLLYPDPLMGPIDNDTLRCGQCGEPFTHLEDVEPHNDGKDGRPSVRLHFSCEMCPSLSTLDFLQHKGCTFASFKTSPNWEEEPAVPTT